MISENNKRFLRQIPFLSNLTEEELLEFFQHLSNPISVGNGEAICREGSHDEGSYIVLEGQCEVYKTINKKKMVVDQIKKTQVIGEMSEFLHGTRSATVKVKSASAKLLKISIKDLPCPLQTKIRENQCRVLAERLTKKNDSTSQLEMSILEIKTIHDKKLAHSEEKHLHKLTEKDVEIDQLKKDIKELRLKFTK